MLHALELSEYKNQPSHRPSLLAQKLGLSIEQIEAYLALLADARLIERRDGRWNPARVLTLDTSTFSPSRVPSSASFARRTSIIFSVSGSWSQMHGMLITSFS